MKLIYSIKGLGSNDLGAELYDRLCSVYPDECGASFWITVPHDDHATIEVIALLTRNGWQIRDHLGHGGWPSFTLDVHREYDRADLKAAEYLLMSPRKRMETATDPGGSIILASGPGEETMLEEPICTPASSGQSCRNLCACV